MTTLLSDFLGSSYIGYTGSKGPIGYTGSQGATGATGSQGPIGYTGSQGATGATGSQGPIGYTGSQGATGSQGPIGYTGSRGPIGYTGSQGATGSQGPIGYTGSAGPSTTISAVNDNSATVHYPVFVAGTGNQTARLSNSGNILSFAPDSGTLNSVAFNSLSDIQLKEDIKPIEDALELLENIQGFRFNWKHSKVSSIGISAQQVETVLPELVHNGQYKTVNYDGLIPLLIQAVKQLNKKMDNL